MAADTLRIVNILLGKHCYYSDSGFVRMRPEHSTRTVFLDSDAYRAFVEMHNAALKEGISLKVMSGLRRFDDQKRIWERKWKALGALPDSQKAARIIMYSSMPSTSRHHWGTDVDINSVDSIYFTRGRGLAEYRWLQANAARFGFFQVYTDKESSNRTGYQVEVWHWSYLPKAIRYLNLYNRLVGYGDISSFSGAHLARRMSVIEEYVNGVEQPRVL